MSKLYYDIPLEEIRETEGRVEEAVIDIPHFREIAEWLPGEWEKCHIQNAFTGILKGKVTACSMSCYQKKQDGHLKSFARIAVEFVPGFYCTKKRRESCWQQLDAQMTDGFGECYDRHEIPGTDGWQLYF